MLKRKGVACLVLAGVITVFSGCGFLNNALGGLSDENNSQTGSISSDLQIDEKEYSIEVIECIGNGSVFISKSKVKENETVIIDVLLETGSYIEKFDINGDDRKFDFVNNQLVIENIRENIEINAVFQTGISYVSIGNKPRIDGKIDEIWQKIPAFYAENIYLGFDWIDNPGLHDTLYDMKAPFVKVMWNESGMYYLGYVYDNEVVEDDRFNIWFSEVYNSTAREYSSNPDSGDYAICANPEGENIYYANMDVSQYWQIGTSKTQDGYIVEIFMPVMGNIPLMAGNYVGFDISVDYYMSGNIHRLAYMNCFELGSYWSNPGALKAIKLLP